MNRLKSDAEEREMIRRWMDEGEEGMRCWVSLFELRSPLVLLRDDLKRFRSEVQR